MALAIGIIPGYFAGLGGGWLGGFISPDVAYWARIAGWSIGGVGRNAIGTTSFFVHAVNLWYDVGAPTSFASLRSGVERMSFVIGL